MSICIGGVCLPLYQALPLLGFLIFQIYNTVTSFCFRKAKKKIVVEIGPNDTDEDIIRALIEGNMHAQLTSDANAEDAGDRAETQPLKVPIGVYPVLSIPHRRCLEVLVQRTATHPNTTVIAKFGATWCPPCVRIGPKYHRLGELVHKKQAADIEHAQVQPIFDVNVIDVDVDEVNSTNIANVKYLPTFVVFKGGKEVESFTGGNEKALTDMINKYT